MGGIHATLVQDEAMRYVDALFVGECEGLRPDVIADVERGELKTRYQGGTTGASLLQPDRAIFRKYRYEYVSAETSRGCPIDCPLCSATVVNGRHFRIPGLDQ